MFETQGHSILRHITGKLHRSPLHDVRWTSFVASGMTSAPDGQGLPRAAELVTGLRLLRGWPRPNLVPYVPPNVDKK
jgi:hypothetical protein